MSPPRSRSPGGTLSFRGGDRPAGSRRAPQPSGDARRWRLQEILVPPRAVGVFSTTYVTWQHKSHGRRRRAEFLTYMAAFEASLSRVAHWAWNHHLAAAKQLKMHLSNFTTLSTSTDAKQTLAGSVPAITIARVGAKGVAYRSRHGESAHILPAVTVH